MSKQKLELEAGIPDRVPSHPGALLADILQSVDKPKTAIAQMLGISRQQFHDILAMRKPVSPEMAVRLGKLFGNGSALWANMQTAHDTWHAERAISAEVKKIPTLKVVA